MAYVLAAEAKEDAADETLNSARAVYEKKGAVASLARLDREWAAALTRRIR
jgi:hypothetical protein